MINLNLKQVSVRIILGAKTKLGNYFDMWCCNYTSCSSEGFFGCQAMVTRVDLSALSI